MRNKTSKYFYTPEEIDFIRNNYNTMSDDIIAKTLNRNPLAIGRKRCELGLSNKIDGRTNHRLYYIWSSMIARCYNTHCKEYKHYGLRGIEVCDEWRLSFWNFATDMNECYMSGLELDRIDNDGSYCKDNCRWVTHSENLNNTRTNIRVTAFGETKTISQWTRDSRCVVKNAHTLRDRIKKGGMSHYDALTVPIGEAKWINSN